MSAHVDKLGEFLREVSNWSWDKFTLAERDETFTSNEAAIFALVRAAAMEKMDAIKLSINRLDGKLKTPVRVEYPKVFYLYPNAAITAPAGAEAPQIETGAVASPEEALEGEILMPAVVEPEPEPDLPSMGFRETLALMSDYPRNLPKQIIAKALHAEQWLRNEAPEPEEGEIPTVKSVVVAHLLVMAQSRNMEAINEVFDSIDGKLVETIQVLGDDLYITDFSGVAPPEARPNKDGILMVEARAAQDQWAAKLKKD